MTNDFVTSRRLPTRRTVLAGLGATAAALATGAVPGARAGETAAAEARFPENFTWGLATSAPQTESRDGRGESIWDAFAGQPGRIRDGSDMRTGTRFETLYASDLDLLAGAGIRAFRFSFAWPRIQPGGKGLPSQQGLDLYDRMVDAMLARGLEPWATTFHWDIPSAQGDWRDRQLAFRFADYAGILASRFGDRIRHWIVLNEPNVVAFLGYARGDHAPGIRSRDAWLAAVHHQNLAQGLGFQALRQSLPAGSRIGTTFNFQPVRAEPNSGATAETAGLLDAVWNRAFFDPLFGRPYPAPLRTELQPLIQADDLQTIAAAPDFLGINYYSRLYAEPDPGNPLGVGLAGGPTPERTGTGWPVEPDGLEEVLLRLRDECGPTPIVVTEFGASFADPPAENGVIADARRIAFLHRHLAAMHSAIAQGSPLAGAFGWAATDNWEWNLGFTQDFGLVGIDRTTLQRTPKQSLYYFGACSRQNAVV